MFKINLLTDIYGINLNQCGVIINKSDDLGRARDQGQVFLHLEVWQSNTSATYTAAVIVLVNNEQVL